MRTLFIGGTRRGYLTLRSLLEAGHPIAGVVSLQQDAHEADRYEDRMRTLAADKGLPLYETKWMKDQDYVSLIQQELRPDIALAVGCRILLPPEVYQAPPRGTLAVHDSYLPEYRGFAPLNWSILNGEDHTGVTLFYLNEHTDAGDVVARRRVAIGPDETASEVYERVCEATTALVLEAWPLLARDAAPRISQHPDEGSFTCARTPGDGYIDWQLGTRRIHDLVRALGRPYPGAFTFHEGKRMFIWRARAAPDGPPYVGRVPGRVVRRNPSDGSIDVLTGDGVLRVMEVQLEGGPAIAPAEVVRSVRATLGISVVTLWEELQRLRAAAAEKPA